MHTDAPLKHLYLHKYRVNLLASEEILLPSYKGSVIRGVFGRVMKRVTCILRNPECDRCILRLRCIFSAIMGSPISEEHPHYRKYKYPQRPYIIVPPLTKKRRFCPGEKFSFDIVLIGMVNDYLPYFVYAFLEMGRLGLGKTRGKFEVLSVEAVDPDGSTIMIFDGSTWMLKAPDLRITYQMFAELMWEGNEVTLVFETPARIKKDDRLVPSLPFHLLIGRLSERAFMLAHLYCGAELGDFEAFAEAARAVRTVATDIRWWDWRRYSSRYKAEMVWGGWVGRVTYRGDLGIYLPLLRIGEYVHVGKATTFGLGKYRLEFSGPLPETL